MGQLFDVESNTITYLLKEIFNGGELEREATTRKFRVVQREGSWSVNREIDYLNEWLFPEQRSMLIEQLDFCDYELAEEYDVYPQFNF